MQKSPFLDGRGLDLPGRREPAQYGRDTPADVEHTCRDEGARLGVEVGCRQPDREGRLLDGLHEAGAEQAAGRPAAPG